jgi:transposase-like protein
MSETLDLEQAIKDIRAGKDWTGTNGVLTPFIKQVTETILRSELEQHIAESTDPNRKNGTTSKTVKTGTGSFKLDTPRDRAGSFEPQLVKKNQTVMTSELDRKILSMFSHGMSYRDIKQHIDELYGVDVSTATISAITDKLLPELKEWQERPLESHYPIVWLDAITRTLCEQSRLHLARFEYGRKKGNPQHSSVGN